MSLEFQLEEIKCKIVAFEKKLARNPGDSETIRVLTQLNTDKAAVEAALNPPVVEEPAPEAEVIQEPGPEASVEEEAETVATTEPAEAKEGEAVKPPTKKKKEN